MMPESVDIFEHAGTGTHSTAIHPGYGTLLCPMDSPVPEHKLLILWLVRKQAQNFGADSYSKCDRNDSK